MKNQTKPKTISFINNKGQIVQIPAESTLADLFKLGVEKIEIVPKDKPIRKGWWRAV